MILSTLKSQLIRIWEWNDPPDCKTILGVTGRVAREIEIACDGICSSEWCSNDRVPNPSQNQQDQHHRHHLQRILVPPLQFIITFNNDQNSRRRRWRWHDVYCTDLNTVKEVGILVLGFDCVHGGIEHLIPAPESSSDKKQQHTQNWRLVTRNLLLSGLAYLESHPQIQKAICNNNKNHVSIFLWE